MTDSFIAPGSPVLPFAFLKMKFMPGTELKILIYKEKRI